MLLLSLTGVQFLCAGELFVLIGQSVGLCRLKHTKVDDMSLVAKRVNNKVSIGPRTTWCIFSQPVWDIVASFPVFLDKTVASETYDFKDATYSTFMRHTWTCVTFL